MSRSLCNGPEWIWLQGAGHRRQHTTIRRSAEIFLKQGGHEVLLAEDGFDALSKVNDHKPHPIFCDILMPRLDGYQTCAIIKRNAHFPRFRS